MKARLIAMTARIRANYLFIPGLMIAGSVLLVYATEALKRPSMVAALREWPLPLLEDPGATRTILATIASSMITIASLVFSLMVVALTLASGQLGPRTIRNFMANRFAQVCMGMFVATFVYCLLSLQYVGNQPAPQIGLLTGILMAVTSCAMLIGFINHIATNIQADKVAATVATELHQILDRQLVDRCEPSDWPEEPTSGTRIRLDVPETGYLQALDHEGLLELSQKQSTQVELHHRPGDFLLRGHCLMHLHGENIDDTTKEEILGAVAIGPERTPTQDIEHGVLQLVEIALRALSPGINDPFTAIYCVNQLAEAVRSHLGRDSGKPFLCDPDGRARVRLHVSDLNGFCEAAFTQIRQCQGVPPAVLITLLERLGDLFEIADDDSEKAALRNQAKLVFERCQEIISQEADMAVVRDRMSAIGDDCRDTSAR